MALELARVKSLFLAASELADLDKRAAFLKCECGGDAELLERVEALLRANDDAPLPSGSVIGGTSEHIPAVSQSVHEYRDPTACVGAIISGRYKLIEEIGEGGMGCVFMALQTKPVKRAVAMKVIKAGMDTKVVLARFEAERQALAMMDHPNIAKVLDAGTTEGGRPYFVMELVKGTPITQFCDERKLTPRQRLELFVPVCQAIQHAHQKGVIHRDIKPSNVLVALYDDRPVPKVIDFGVAKAAGQSLTDKTLMTGFGAVVGTPEYMSPEQANLNNIDIDTRSDVYSLGVLLYELLTGSTPVDKKSLGRAAILEILRIVREVEAPRPSAKLSTIDTLPNVAANRGTEPMKLSKLMKGELDWLVLKALEKDRTRRYDTANGLARDIQRYLANEIVEARPPSTMYRLNKAWQRNKLVFSAFTAIAFSILFGIVISVWQTFRAEREAERAINALNELRDTAPAFVAQARALTAKEQFADAIEKLEYASKLRPDEANYWIARGNLLQCQFRFKEAAEVYQTALLLRPDDPRTSANVALCEELQSASRSTNGQLNRESLSKLMIAMQNEQRSAAELMPVSRLLGEEKRHVLAYWLERLKGLPIPSEKPLTQRLTVLDDGMLSFDLSGTKIIDLKPLEGAPFAVLDLTGASELTQIVSLRGMKLKELSLNRTKVSDLSPLERMRSLEKLDLKQTPVADLTALTGIPLKHIELTNCPVRDLSPLRGAPIELLYIMSTRVTDLSPLIGMPVKHLDMGMAPVTDFTPLKGLPLELCNFPGCQITDLGILRDSPIKELMLWNCPSARNYAVLSEIKTLELLILPFNFRQLPVEEITAIEALRKHPKLKQLGYDSSLDHTTTGSVETFWKNYDKIQDYRAQLMKRGVNPRRVIKLPDGTLDLDFSDSALVDLTVLQGLPVSELWIAGTRVTDLSPLLGFKLRKLHLFNTKVTDLSPLSGMPLEFLNLVETRVSDISPLRGMPLTGLRLNGCKDLKDISALQSCKALGELTLPENAMDYEFLRTLPNLQRLAWHEDEQNGWRPNQTASEFWQDYESISFAKSIEKAGFKATRITGGWSFRDQPIKDLNLLKGQQITCLDLGDTPVEDLTPIKGMPLTTLWIYNSKVVDLSPLQGMTLEHLNLNETNITDISVLRDMPLKILHLSRCKKLQNISPLLKIKTLEELTLPINARDIAVLRELPNLKRISYYEDTSNFSRPDKTTAEFWARYDRIKAMDLNPPVMPKESLTPSEAAKRFNETVTVRFTIRSSGKSRHEKWYFLNSHEDFRKPENFTIAVQDPTVARLKQLGLSENSEEMLGKTVVARGKVGQVSGRTQIVVSDEDWVWIVEAK